MFFFNRRMEWHLFVILILILQITWYGGNVASCCIPLYLLYNTHYQLLGEEQAFFAAFDVLYLAIYSSLELKHSRKSSCFIQLMGN